jgi:hypothetical protein
VVDDHHPSPGVATAGPGEVGLEVVAARTLEVDGFRSQGVAHTAMVCRVSGWVPDGG